MSHRLIYETLSELARRVQSLDDQPAEEVPFDLLELDKQIKRLAREIYKANTLTETQTEQNRQAVEAAQHSLETLQSERQTQREQDRDALTRQARLDVIKTLLPVLDGIESGINSGAVQIKSMMTTAPEAARVLIGWLNGQRLLRERLLKVLEADDVIPMVTVGQPFDPYRHVAVKTASEHDKAEGLILREERRGYMQGDSVLRYADVIVNKTDSQAANKQG